MFGISLNNMEVKIKENFLVFDNQGSLFDNCLNECVGSKKKKCCKKYKKKGKFCGSCPSK